MSRKVSVKVHAGSSKNEAIFISENELEIWISQIPEKGKANKAVISLLSEILKIPKSSIKLIKGETSKLKKFEIES